jgi:DNA-binding MarR family transcriptional regulator
MGKEAGGRMGIVTALVRSSFLVNAVYTESGRTYGLTPQQGQLLCVLMPQPYGMGELGAVLGLAKSSLTGLVDRTARRGLVRRRADPVDRRVVRVELTERGAALAERFHAETCRQIERLPEELAEPDRAALAVLLGRLVRANEVPDVFMEPGEFGAAGGVGGVGGVGEANDGSPVPAAARAPRPPRLARTAPATRTSATGRRPTGGR